MKKALCSLIFVFVFNSCGTSCLEEERQVNNCIELMLVSYAACMGNANVQTDSQQQLTTTSSCFGSMIAGIVFCEVQIDPYCR